MTIRPRVTPCCGTASRAAAEAAPGAGSPAHSGLVIFPKKVAGTAALMHRALCPSAIGISTEAVSSKLLGLHVLVEKFPRA